MLMTRITLRIKFFLILSLLILNYSVEATISHIFNIRSKLR